MSGRRAAFATLERLQAIAEARQHAALGEATRSYGVAERAHGDGAAWLAAATAQQTAAASGGSLLDLARYESLRAHGLDAARTETRLRAERDARATEKDSAVDALADLHRRGQAIERGVARIADAAAKVTVRRDEDALTDAWRGREPGHD